MGDILTWVHLGHWLNLIGELVTIVKLRLITKESASVASFSPGFLDSAFLMAFSWVPFSWVPFLAAFGLWAWLKACFWLMACSSKNVWRLGWFFCCLLFHLRHHVCGSLVVPFAPLGRAVRPEKLEQQQPNQIGWGSLLKAPSSVFVQSLAFRLCSCWLCASPKLLDWPGHIKKNDYAYSHTQWKIWGFGECQKLNCIIWCLTLDLMYANIHWNRIAVPSKVSSDVL